MHYAYFTKHNKDAIPQALYNSIGHGSSTSMLISVFPPPMFDICQGHAAVFVIVQHIKQSSHGCHKFGRKTLQSSRLWGLVLHLALSCHHPDPGPGTLKTATIWFLFMTTSTSRDPTLTNRSSLSPRVSPPPRAMKPVDLHRVPHHYFRNSHLIPNKMAATSQFRHNETFCLPKSLWKLIQIQPLPVEVVTLFLLWHSLH